MSWLRANSLILIALVPCLGMHLFYGHGNHGATDEYLAPRDQNNHF